MVHPVISGGFEVPGSKYSGSGRSLFTRTTSSPGLDEKKVGLGVSRDPSRTRTSLTGTVGPETPVGSRTSGRGSPYPTGRHRVVGSRSSGLRLGLRFRVVVLP